MTKKQYISHLVSEKEPLLGKDIPQESRAVVIDGLREIISDKDILLAEREKQIANLQKQNEYFKRMLFGRKSEKLHPDDPSQLTLDFGEETVMPLTTEELKEAEDRVNSKLEEVRKNAEQRRSDKKTQSSRKGKEYRGPRGQVP